MPQPAPHLAKTCPDSKPITQLLRGHQITVINGGGGLGCNTGRGCHCSAVLRGPQALAGAPRNLKLPFMPAGLQHLPQTTEHHGVGGPTCQDLLPPLRFITPRLLFPPVWKRSIKMLPGPNFSNLTLPSFCTARVQVLFVHGQPLCSTSSVPRVQRETVEHGVSGARPQAVAVGGLRTHAGLSAAGGHSAR